MIGFLRGRVFASSLSKKGKEKKWKWKWALGREWMGNRGLVVFFFLWLGLVRKEEMSASK